jgi:hypothetical protein
MRDGHGARRRRYIRPINLGSTAAVVWSRRRPALAGAAVAVVIVAVIVWLVADRGDGTGAPQAADVPTARPVAISEDALRTLAEEVGPLYWAGPQAGAVYELTRAAGGQTYIRYLRSESELGDVRPRFLSVATYRQRGAYAALRAAARRKGSVSRRTPTGALVIYDRARPTNVYFASPEIPVQVEVYDPEPGRARSLVLDGRVREIE